MGHVRWFNGGEWLSRCALLARRCFRHWYMPVGYDPTPYRNGESEGRMFARRLRLPKPHIPMWLVSHAKHRCFDAYDVEWIFNTLSARARASNGRARSQKYPLDCLLSPRTMDRSICIGSARALVFWRHDSSLRHRDERSLISVSATPAMSVTPKI